MLKIADHTGVSLFHSWAPTLPKQFADADTVRNIIIAEYYYALSPYIITDRVLPSIIAFAARHLFTTDLTTLHPWSTTVPSLDLLFILLRA
jgi:hypothetical protein